MPPLRVYVNVILLLFSLASLVYTAYVGSVLPGELHHYLEAAWLNATTELQQQAYDARIRDLQRTLDALDLGATCTQCQVLYGATAEHNSSHVMYANVGGHVRLTEPEYMRCMPCLLVKEQITKSMNSQWQPIASPKAPHNFHHPIAKVFDTWLYGYMGFGRALHVLEEYGGWVFAIAIGTLLVQLYYIESYIRQLYSYTQTGAPSKKAEYADAYNSYKDDFSIRDALDSYSTQEGWPRQRTTNGRTYV